MCNIINFNGLCSSSGTIKQKTGTVSKQPEADYVQKIVCNDDEIKENEMKQFALDEDLNKILLIRQHGELSAIGTKCTHYGALLSTGALGEGRVRCPWHGACFNIKNGDIEDFPGQDSIPCYKVTVTDGKVNVRAKRSDLIANKRLKDMVSRDPKNNQCFVIIGGGPSAGVCVETLRQEGFTGRVVMVCKEDYLPYDRVKVSKAMDFDIHKTEYRTRAFYEEYGIEAMTGVEATAVNASDKTVTLSNGTVLQYDKLYIATGCKAEKVKIPGSELKNVMTMRDYVDSAYVTSQLSPEKHVVCLGLSFVGLESAAYCVDKVAKVTVVGRDSVLLRHSFGPEVGNRVQQMFEEKNINFILSSGIKRCIDTDGKLSAVELVDGTVLKCDVCIMGTGSSPFTKFMEGSGVSLNKDGSIDTNVYLQTSDPNIYVGGDIANSPVLPIGNAKANIGHYPLAQYHGRMAAKNMVGHNEEIRAVPYFWTVLFGKSFRYSGYGVPHETQIVGSVEDLKYVAIYFDKDGKVIGMSSCQRDPVVSQFAEFLAQGRTLTKFELIDDPLAWTKTIVRSKNGV